LAGHIAHDEAKFVEPKQEVLKLLHAEPQRSELALEALADFFQRGMAVEHAEDRTFLVAKAKELERYGVVDDPVALRLAAVRCQDEVRPHSDFEGIHRGSMVSVACIPGRNFSSAFSTSAQNRTCELSGSISGLINTI